MADHGIKDPKVLAQEMHRRPEAIRKKLERMGVVVVGHEKNTRTTTTTIESKDLLTHEEALKLLSGALNLLQEPGQDKLELQRLRILVDAVQTYDSVITRVVQDWLKGKGLCVPGIKRRLDPNKVRFVERALIDIGAQP